MSIIIIYGMVKVIENRNAAIFIGMIISRIILFLKKFKD